MLKRMPIITLTSDFGLKDPFAGIMKGVMLGINPDVNIVDITHDISQHNILEASEVVARSCRFFPPPSIHVVVVDPGVGGQRRPILVLTGEHYFIGPDNGVFSRIYDEADPAFLKVLHLTATHYFQPMGGATFDGRDIFAPVAAWFSKGILSSKLGDEITDYVTLPSPRVALVDSRRIDGEVVSIDNFGNAITNISGENIESISPGNSVGSLKLRYKDMDIPIVHHYEESSASDSRLSGLLNSFGLIELFLFRSSAAEKFGIAPGDKVSVAAG